MALLRQIAEGREQIAWVRSIQDGTPRREPVVIDNEDFRLWQERRRQGIMRLPDFGRS
jgi:hypothetical protein